MREEKYNGWTNYQTWRVNLEIFDEIPEDWNEITADDCKCYAEMIVDNGSSEGFALDYALAFLQDVNWQEIADHLNEGLRINHT
jgi:hypothetical protein